VGGRPVPSIIVAPSRNMPNSVTPYFLRYFWDSVIFARLIETAPKKSWKCFTENPLKTKSLIVLELPFI
jgi:hypothetical protein